MIHSMKELHVEKLTVDELKTLIETVVTVVVRKEFNEQTESRARSPTGDDDFIGCKEVMKILDRSRPAIYAYTKKGLLKAYRLPPLRWKRWKRSEVIAAMQQVSFKYLNK